jgi:hypothetical protein
MSVAFLCIGLRGSTILKIWREDRVDLELRETVDIEYK